MLAVAKSRIRIASIQDAIEGVDVVAAGKLTVAERITRADKCATIIGPSGDSLMWATEKEDRAAIRGGWAPSADIARAIADGVSILAHRPHGVTFAGRHWCATGHDDCAPGEVLDYPIGDRGGQGASYTPASLAQKVVRYPMEALVYEPGPLQTANQAEWRLIPSRKIAELKNVDPCMGSGGLLLALTRYVADRLIEAWIIESGVPHDEPVSGAQWLQARTVALGTIHGVDVDPWAIELAKLTLALLVPTVHTDIDTRIKRGDALLGVTSWQAIQRLTPSNSHRDPEYDPVFTDIEMCLIHSFYAHHTNLRWMAFTLADLSIAWALFSAAMSDKAEAEIRAEALRLARKLFDQPDCRDLVEEQIAVWLKADRPDKTPVFPPVHMPLEFPHVFPFGHKERRAHV